MREAEITAELIEHASGSSSADGQGLADALWQRRMTGAVVDVSALWEKLASLLQALADLRIENVDVLTFRRHAYAVSEMLSGLASEALSGDEPHNSDIRVLMWHLACGWEAVLAGDEADLAEHVRLEALARGIERL